MHPFPGLWTSRFFLKNPVSRLLDFDVGEDVLLEGQLVGEHRVRQVGVPHPDDVAKLVDAVIQSPRHNVVKLFVSVIFEMFVR